MTLKNLMEKKQLNFDQPLLSVRRGSLTGSSPEVSKTKTNNSNPQLPALPYYKSDLKSGPVRNPGAIPFQWERSPGRPKDEKNDASEITVWLHPAPRLPPGRIVDHKKKLTDNAECDPHVSSSRSHSGSNILCSPGSSSVDKVLSEFEGFGERKKEQNVSSSDDENVVYEDARDTLSRTESFIYNCSLSGVSGLDVPNMDASRPVLDPQARDFMMGRFLPGAKAVASETPQFGSRKHHVSREQPRPIMKVVTKRSAIDYNLPSTSSPNVHKELEVEEEDDVDDFDDAKDFPVKLCGLLPRLCLLNPIPGMRDQAQLISSVQSARPFGGMRSKTVNKDRTHNYLGEVKRITYLHGPTNKSTPTAHFGHNGNAPWKSDSSISFLRERGFCGLPEEPKDSAEAPEHDPKAEALLENHNVEEMINPVNTTSEKMLCIDSKSKIDSDDSNSSSFGSGVIKSSDCLSRQNMKLLHLGPEHGALSQAKSSDIVDAWLLSSSNNQSLNYGEDTFQTLSKDQNPDLVLNTKLSKKSHVEETNKKSGPSLALAPFLPKSPSESWLSRTLPSMSTKHPSSKLYSGNVTLKTSHLDNTRDRLLKPSNGQHLLLPPTRELATISED